MLAIWTIRYCMEVSRSAQIPLPASECQRWQDLGISDLRVAVNLSMPMLQRPDFAEMVLGILDQCGLSPSKLELELTE